MQRLLMGEVGAGKTVLGLYAMLRAIEAGHQAALMAPTETLAEQHFRTLEAADPGSRPRHPADLGDATGRAPRAARLPRRREPQLVVGTHALIEDAVEFSSLAVAVVDEQHRFGVRQRAALDAKGPGERLPHVLHMTATPIPRTLSLTAYGDLDTTSLRELPKGRQPIETRVVDEEHRAAAYEFIRERLREGRQAYVVCPLVSDSEAIEAKAAEAEAKRLAKGELRDFRVALLHGQMSSEQKARAMDAFASGEAARPGGHHGDRGRHRRAERDGDARRGSGALRPLAAPPAPRPGGPRASTSPSASSSVTRSRRRPRRDSRRSRGRGTASRSPRST